MNIESSYCYIQLNDFVMELMSIGAHVKVIEPQSLKKEMIKN
jgi:predicted DNA-binding transcriptional regulator YafY